MKHWRFAETRRRAALNGRGESGPRKAVARERRGERRRGRAPLVKMMLRETGCVPAHPRRTARQAIDPRAARSPARGRSIRPARRQPFELVDRAAGNACRRATMASVRPPPSSGSRGRSRCRCRRRLARSPCMWRFGVLARRFEPTRVTEQRAANCAMSILGIVARHRARRPEHRNHL